MKDCIYTVLKDGRLLYEGPIQKTAGIQFEKATRSMNGGSTFRVRKNSRLSYEGSIERRAKAVFVDLLQELETTRRATIVLEFEVSSGSARSSFTVKPFAERLLGGDPQHGA